MPTFNYIRRCRTPARKASGPPKNPKPILSGCGFPALASTEESEAPFLLLTYTNDYGTLLDDNEAYSEPVVEKWFDSWNEYYDYGALQRRFDDCDPIIDIQRYFEWLECAVTAWDPSKAKNRRALELLSDAEPDLREAPSQETVFGWIVSKRDDLARILGGMKK